jgi:hypothetical protein
MNQSVIVKDETLNKIVAHAQEVVGRDLEGMEIALLDFAIEQIRLGLVK